MWWELRKEWRLEVRAECHYRYVSLLNGGFKSMRGKSKNGLLELTLLLTLGFLMLITVMVVESFKPLYLKIMYYSVTLSFPDSNLVKLIFQ